MVRIRYSKLEYLATNISLFCISFPRTLPLTDRGRFELSCSPIGSMYSRALLVLLFVTSVVPESTQVLPPSDCKIRVNITSVLSSIRLARQCVLLSISFPKLYCCIRIFVIMCNNHGTRASCQSQNVVRTTLVYL